VKKRAERARCKSRVIHFALRHLPGRKGVTEKEREREREREELFRHAVLPLLLRAPESRVHACTCHRERDNARVVHA